MVEMIALVGALMLSAPPNEPLSDPLSQMETGLVEWIDAHNAVALEQLETAVNINSGTMNFAGVQEVAGVYRPPLQELGFEVEWIDGTPFDRAGHLAAARDGQPGSLKVLMIGHLDTVFEPDSDFQRFELLEESRARGPGTTDMKGGNTIIIQALGALASIGVLDELSVRVVLTGDEERRGRPLDIATQALTQAGEWADIALGFEDGDGDPTTAVISRRGSSGWTLTVDGQAAHSSQVFREDIGFGAIYEAARIIDQFRRELQSMENLTFNPGMIVGGTDVSHDSTTASGTAFGKNNVIAAHAVVTGDLRAMSLEQRDQAEQAMQAIVAQSLAGASATLEFSHSYPPMDRAAGNKRLLRIYSQVSEDLSFGPVAPVDPRKAGAADISFVADRVEMAMDGLGLMGEGGHTLNEIADLDTLPSQTKRAAVLLCRLSEACR